MRDVESQAGVEFEDNHVISPNILIDEEEIPAVSAEVHPVLICEPDSVFLDLKVFLEEATELWRLGVPVGFQGRFEVKRKKFDQYLRLLFLD
jgi:hypothetical protein